MVPTCVNVKQLTVTKQMDNESFSFSISGFQWLPKPVAGGQQDMAWETRLWVPLGVSLLLGFLPGPTHPPLQVVLCMSSPSAWGHWARLWPRLVLN